MYFNNKEIPTKHYSILLKGAKTTMVICADELKQDNRKANYEFYIQDNLVAMLPTELVENIV